MGVTTSGRPAETLRSGWTAEPTARSARRRRAFAGMAGLVLLTLGALVLQSLVPMLQASPAAAGIAPSVQRTEFTSLGEPVRIPVTSADRITVTEPPARGTATVEGTDVVYTPRPEHIGEDTLTLTACSGQECATATVQVRTGRPGTAAVAVSVTVHGSTRTGQVTVDGGSGPVTALDVARAGATTSNLVIVPVNGTTLTVVSRPGGGLTVDIVGTFSAADTASAGRFVPVEQTRVVSLKTATQGRDATVDARSFGAEPGIRAVLAVVTAEMGKNPAWVDLGREPGQIDRTMSWGPGTGTKERRALTLVPVNAEGRFSLRYEHGSRIDVDVLGFFTGDGAKNAVAGLYVPRTPSVVFDGTARPQDDRIDVPAAASAVFVNLSGRPGVSGRLPAGDVGIASGRTIGTALPAAAGTTEIRAARPLPVRVTLLGYFAAGT